MTLDGPAGLTPADRGHADRQDTGRQDARDRAIRSLKTATPPVSTEPLIAHSGPDADTVMRLEIRHVDTVDLPSLPSLAGTWAWLLFHGDGTLIAYSDGYAMRSNCIAAAKRVGCPIDIAE
ncbi:MAG: DUF1508 domain-containing protein [Sphingomonas sp.]|nr:MAG: DUF1508 domain-containing protein [Sphingomonas sp.]